MKPLPGFMADKLYLRLLAFGNTLKLISNARWFCSFERVLAV